MKRKWHSSELVIAAMEYAGIFSKGSTMNSDMKTIEKAIARLEKEKRIMLKCADLNPREDGSSYYMQRAIQCDKEIAALLRVLRES